MRVVFLDIDGVLNSDGFAGGAEGDWWSVSNLDPRSVALLDELVTRSEAVVVISSTWRQRHTPAALATMLEARGFRGRVVGATPALSRDAEGRRLRRGDEVQAWIDAQTEAVDFVILDDGDDLGALRPRLVRTDPAVGLTRADVARALALFDPAF